MSKEKTSLIKKWWFWVIIVVIVIAVGGGIAASNNSPKKVGENDTDTSSSSTQAAEPANKEYAINDIIAVDGTEITVTKVDRNYDAGNDYFKPSDGKEYVKVSVQIENKSSDKVSYNSMLWKIEDASGDINGIASLGYSIDDALNSGELSKGGKKVGALLFEVPQDSALKLHYQYDVLSSDKEVIIKL